ncbi:MAG: hypothetical protein ACKOCA_11470 [Vulcanococcus sp.]
MKRQLTTLLLSSLLACPALGGNASADTASFVAANRTEISGEVSELSHVLLIQIPRHVVMDVGAGESTTMTVPALAEISINGQKVAPANTPILIAIEPDAKQGVRVKLRGMMLQGKLVALEGQGDLIPAFVVDKKDFNDRVRSAMNLGAALGNGISGTLGSAMLGQVGAAMGDPTGVGVYSQIVSASGLMGMMSGMFTGGSGKLIIDLPANSTHVLTLKNPAMVVAQVVQLNRELAKGNGHVVGSIASRLKTTGANSYSDNIAVGAAGGTRMAQANARRGSR